MYRESHRVARPPTVIEYRSYWVRPGYLVLALFVLFMALGLPLSTHATHLTCTRSGPDDAGSCRIQRYGLFESWVVDVPASDIADLMVTERTGSKGAKYAEIELHTKLDAWPRIDVESGGGVSRVDPKDAQTLRWSFDAWLQRRTMSLDEWPSRGPLSNLPMTVFSIVFAVFGLTMLFEQLHQLRPIRMIVDHTRQVLRVRGEEVPFVEIDDVTIELGRALFWSSAKNEHVPGHRIVIERKNGKPILVTKGFRAGDRFKHELARRELLAALDRAAS